MSSTKFVLFGLIVNQRWSKWPLIGWDIFLFLLWDRWTEFRRNFSLYRKLELNVLCKICVFRTDQKTNMTPATSEWLRHFRLLLWNRWWNLTKLARKQETNALYQVFYFHADWKTKMAALAFDWLRYFRLLWNWTEFDETLQEARTQRPLPSLCFGDRKENQDGRPSPWFVETFSTFQPQSLHEIQGNLTGMKISASSIKFMGFFWPIGKQQHGHHCLLLAETFPLLLCNHWTKFNETWQEARSQRPLPGYGFRVNRKTKMTCSGLWLADTSPTSPLELLNRIKWNFIRSKFGVFEKEGKPP